MHVHFTRHAETRANVERVHHGDPKKTITAQGCKHIDMLAKKLAREQIDVIISSDMNRCKETTARILQQIKVPVIFTTLLREKENGDFAGKSYANDDWGKLAGNFETRKPLGGENLIEVRERARTFFADLIKRKEERILVVTHGAFLRVLFGDLLGMSLHNSIFRFKINHCSLSLVQVENKKEYCVVYINNSEFLSPG